MSLFLIGAGFNVNATREAGPVYGNSIYAGRYLMDCGYPSVPDVARLCFGLPQVPTGKSIEGLFSESLERNDYAPLQKLAERLMEADFRLATRLASSDASNCYRKFFDTFAKAHFLTFNYDSLPELFLFRLRRWYPHDGYGVPVNVMLSPLAAHEFDGRTSTSKVLHLHGSFCLRTSEFEIQRGAGDSIPWLVRREAPCYSFDPDSITLCFSPYQRVVANTGRVPIEERVIAPVPDKAQELKQPFISETYGKACSLVRESGALVAIGYSFNSCDRASYDPVLQALCQSRDRKLLVVSPQARDLAEKIRAEYRDLQVKPIDKTFKGWAEDSFPC